MRLIVAFCVQISVNKGAVMPSKGIAHCQFRKTRQFFLNCLFRYMVLSDDLLGSELENEYN